MIDLGLLEQQQPRQKRARGKFDLIGDLAAGADLRKKQFDNERSAHDADLADSYREALRTRNPQDEMGIQDLAEQGFGPEVTPYRTELANREEKRREFNQTDENLDLTRQGNEDFRNSQTKNMEAQRIADAAKLAEDRRFHDMQSRWEMIKANKPNGTNTLGLTPGEKALDINFAKDNQDFIGGGFSDAQKGLVELKNIQKRLAGSEGVKPEKLTGTAFGYTPDFAKDFFFPQATDARQRVENIVQRNLRPILGAQFTENEGKRLIERAYNPKLSPKLNADRLERLAIQMKKALDAKMEQADYFEKQGTLKGYNPSVLYRNADDFNFEDKPPVGEQQIPASAPVVAPVDVNHALADSIFGTPDYAKAVAIFKKHKKAK